MAAPNSRCRSAPTTAFRSNPDLLVWGIPYTVRVPLGAIPHDGPSPLAVGDNAFQFFAENTGILDVHVEVAYPPGSAPAYTPPSAIHDFPLHSELPRLGSARALRADRRDAGRRFDIT